MSIRETIPAELLGFRGDDETMKGSVLLEVTEQPAASTDGLVEVGFKAGNQHLYLRFQLHELVRAAVARRLR